ncbi:MAG: dTDP-glucose 4,6-dehydratase [Microgenomates bacterium OLB22]|nr:MAG: dTDP-glucose 4,6-dehydratase [Microgenomates bacterium OLB22]
MKESYLVTGGSGFVAQHMAQRLLKETDGDVVLMQRGKTHKEGIIDSGWQSRLSIVVGDITKEDDVLRAVGNCSVVIHTAAVLKSLPEHYRGLIDTNIVGTGLLLEAARKHGVSKFIHLSSAAVYGNLMPGREMDEHHPHNPLNMYGATKVSAEALVHAYFIAHGLPAVIVRPFNIYGPGQEPPLMVPLFIDKLIRDEPIVLNNGGLQRRDWLFIHDFTEALLCLLNTTDNVAGETYNICSGEATSIRTVAEIVLDKLAKSHELVEVQTLQQVETIGNAGNADKFKTQFGWKPQTSLDEGIEHTIHWHQKKI